MFHDLNFENILFIDIETVPQYKDYKDSPLEYKILWEKKSSYLVKHENDTPEILFPRAGIYAEFGKIICISAGFLRTQNDNYQFRIKSFFNDNEKIVLEEFINLLKFYEDNKREIILCAHNGKEFDFPFICRRLLINGLNLPNILQIASKKPWEISHLDTLDLWKFGDFKHYTSLELLAYIFNIPTPKIDINGSEVARVYYEEKNLKRIVEYCQRDVLTVAQLLLKYVGKDIISENQVFIQE